MTDDGIFADYAEGLVVDPDWFGDLDIEAVNAVADSLPDSLPGNVIPIKKARDARELRDRKSEVMRKMKEAAKRTQELRAKALADRLRGQR